MNKAVGKINFAVFSLTLLFVPKAYSQVNEAGDLCFKETESSINCRFSPAYVAIDDDRYFVWSGEKFSVRSTSGSGTGGIYSQSGEIEPLPTLNQPEATFGGYVFKVGRKVIVYGGIVSEYTLPRRSNQVYPNQGRIFDLDTFTWSLIPDFNAPPSNAGVPYHNRWVKDVEMDGENLKVC